MSDKPKADDGGAAAAVYSKLYHEERAKREQLERELSAANARIAELEEILGLNCNHKWFRTGEMEYGARRCINCGVMVTAPSQPTTLPE